MSLPDPVAVVRLTDAAVNDLLRIQKKNPAVLRSLLKKMLLLERSPEAGEPLLGPLVGFRKLTVGNREWRIVWRASRSSSGVQVLDVAEVWTAGMRSGSEVYEEMKARVAAMRASGDPHVQPLADVVELMGDQVLTGGSRPGGPAALPSWLIQALRVELRLTDQVIARLDEQAAQDLIMQHWSKSRLAVEYGE